VPHQPKPAFTAAVALQSGVGNAQAFTRTIAPSTTGNASDAFVLEFASGGGQYSYAAWTNVTACTSPSQRVDCGFYGITRDECVARGCCFDEWDTTNQTQCYFGAPRVNFTFTAAPAAAQHCFKASDVLGRVYAPTCADASGRLTVSVSDAPVQLLW